jgi:hypothetical protein
LVGESDAGPSDHNHDNRERAKDVEAELLKGRAVLREHTKNRIPQ